MVLGEGLEPSLLKDAGFESVLDLQFSLLSINGL